MTRCWKSDKSFRAAGKEQEAIAALILKRLPTSMLTTFT